MEFDFYFDVISPASYIAFHRLPDLHDLTGASVNWKPMFLGGVMKATGNRPPGSVPAKGRYLLHDLQRCARFHGIPFHFNPHFPFNTLPLMRASTALLDDERFLPFATAAFNAIWQEQHDLSDNGMLRAWLQNEGFKTDDFETMINEPGIKQQLTDTTEEAVRRGVFGAPTFFVGDEMFFGQDRMDYLARALTGTR